MKKIKHLPVLFYMLLSFSLLSCSNPKNALSNEVFVTEANSSAKEKITSNVLYILDGKEIDKTILKSIEPNSIKSINVIKDKKEIKKYTTKTYEGVIVIHLKK